MDPATCMAYELFQQEGREEEQQMSLDVRWLAAPT